MDGRQELVRRGLAAPAVSRLTARALGRLPFEALGPTKAVLKRFFSPGEWSAADEDELAGVVGPGEGWWREELDGEVAIEFGWEGGRFRLAATAAVGGPAAPPVPVATALDLAATFDGPVVPEATPNPRTLVFRTGPVHDGDSREYRAGAGTPGDRRVDRLFRSFPDLATVLVARDFVALSVRRPGQWETLLAPVLEVVTEEFARSEDTEPRAAAPSADVDVRGVAARPASAGSRRRQPTAVDRAWAELGRLRPDRPDQLAALIVASAHADAAHRQV
ncbi:MAG: NifU N-terminal domain-containing protein, partial [Acidimicrobiales bacterium]